MNNNIKKEVYMISVFELKTLETHFAQMAAKGWLIDKMKLFWYEYKKIEPCELRFFVDILPQITAFDYPENENTLEYRRICEESGWTFAAASKQIQVFYTDKKLDMPVPIHTDSKIEAKIMLKTSLKYELPSFLVGFYYICFLWFNITDKGYDMLLSNITIAQIISAVFFAPPLLWYIFSLAVWIFKMIRRTKKELPPLKVNYKLSRLRGIFFGIAVIIVMLTMLAGVLLDILGGMPPIIFLGFLIPFSAIAIGLTIRKFVDTKNRERNTNKWIFAAGILLVIVLNIAFMFFLVSYFGSSLSEVNELPENRTALRLADFDVKTSPDVYNYYGRSSIVIPLNYTYYEIGPEASVHTDVMKTINNFLAYRLFQKQYEELNKREWLQVTRMTPDEAEGWGAADGYYINPDNSRLLLLYNTTILQIDYSGDIFNDFIIREKVKSIAEYIE